MTLCWLSSGDICSPLFIEETNDGQLRHVDISIDCLSLHFWISMFQGVEFENH